MTRRVISLYDPPIRLGDGAILENYDILLQRPVYGRILFTTSVAIEACGRDIVIRNNQITGV